MYIYAWPLFNKINNNSIDNYELVEVRTQWVGQQPVDDDVGVAPDGGCEVGVERNVQGVVLKEVLRLKSSWTEVQRHLGEKTNNKYRNSQKYYLKLFM